MKTIHIDQQRLVKVIAHLTHNEVEPSEWPWVVTFAPEDDAPTAEISLPSRVNTQGGFESARTTDEGVQPSSTTGLSESVMTTPLSFVALDNNFHWDGEIPDAANLEHWQHSDVAQVAEYISQRLRREVEIDGEQYQVAYE